MKHISVYDLKRVPELANIPSEQLVKPESDYLLEPVLHALGFDVNKTILYDASKHKTLDGTVVIDFVLLGESRQDEEFLDSSMATREDRRIALGCKDVELAKVLNELETRHRDYGVAATDYSSRNSSDLIMEEHHYEPGWRVAESQIKALKQHLKIVRGNIWDGDYLKPWKEFRNPPKPIEKSTRRKPGRKAKTAN